MRFSTSPVGENARLYEEVGQAAWQVGWVLLPVINKFPRYPDFPNSELTNKKLPKNYFVAIKTLLYICASSFYIETKD